jgi:cleavage and polyadenylation specificity factor subunit 1
MTLVAPFEARPTTQNIDADGMDIDPVQATSTAHSILLTSSTGSLSLITPLSESTYRRLSTLQNVLLASTLDSHAHYASLNPRAYRQVETDGVGGRGIIDGDLVRRWWEASTQQRANSADKAGGSVWDIRADLAVAAGQGLRF